MRNAGMRERAQGLSFVLSGENRQLAGVPDVWACQKEQLNRTLLQFFNFLDVKSQKIQEIQ